MTCNACNRTIFDRQMSKTSPDNKIWHSECLKCCECHKLLDYKYFETDGRLYCLNDYLAYHGPTCFGCDSRITNEQYFFKIEQTITSTGGDLMNGQQTTQLTNAYLFHDRCFACHYCANPLRKGEKYCILDNSATPTKPLIISHDFCALKYHSANINNNNNSNNNNLQSNNNNNNNPMHGGAMQPNLPAPRAKRGRMKQNRPA